MADIDICRIAIHDDNLTRTALESLMLVSGMKIQSLSSLSGQLNNVSFRLFPMNLTSCRYFPNMDIFVVFKNPDEPVHEVEKHNAEIERQRREVYKAHRIPVIKNANDWKRLDPISGSSTFICSQSVTKMWTDIFLRIRPGTTLVL